MARLDGGVRGVVRGEERALDARAPTERELPRFDFTCAENEA